ncbi:hypothetical protein EIP91_005663 [Steccherinum ochraceum]|uniref:Protein kinase domain-containing protein n=1 Tax=Steccherinum ochraceum TaxID=92696 RepID=A0A4V2MVP2_9APHY|nr:hypothetical protein EIP91_005663 [Steccherinum ochraceum]
MLRDLDHPNIVQYLGSEQTPTSYSLFMEYLPGGTIASYVQKYGKLSDELTLYFTCQLLDGIDYIHSQNIVHRNLTSAHILIDASGSCKISSFGLARRCGQVFKDSVSITGSAFYMPPEAISNKNVSGNNGTKYDIWSAGCVVLEMCTGRRPWNDMEAMAVLLKLYQAEESPGPPPGTTLSAESADFCKLCFISDPAERPSASELKSHGFAVVPTGWSLSGVSQALAES